MKNTSSLVVGVSDTRARETQGRTNAAMSAAANDARIAQFKRAAEDDSLRGDKRAREVKNLETFLHKHQGDHISGPSRSALATAIEVHYARSPAGDEAVHKLLETALKMPDKLFAESHKKLFLKWFSQEEAVGEEGGGSLELALLDIGEDGTPVFSYSDGTLFEGEVFVEDWKALAAAHKKAVECEGEVLCTVSARAGRLVLYSYTTQ